jgi:alkyldihydroxyacetonephosphate synthase
LSLELDRESLLVGVPGAATLGGIEAALAEHGLTLGPVSASRPEATVGEWLAAGAPGAPNAFADPADHLVAGLTTTLADGRRLEIRPSPRRAVGPDLVALVLGAGDRFATMEHAWLRVHRRDARVPSAPLPGFDLDPPVSEAESKLLAAIARELR